MSGDCRRRGHDMRMRILIGVTAFLLLVTRLSVVALAHDPAAYLRAGEELEALFAQAAKDGRAPRLADRNVAQRYPSPERCLRKGQRGGDVVWAVRSRERDRSKGRS